MGDRNRREGDVKKGREGTMNFLIPNTCTELSVNKFDTQIKDCSAKRI